MTATDDVTTPIVRNADLAIDKSVSQTSATAGDQFNWILDITNHGPDTATNVVVSDTIPAQFEVIGTFPTVGLTCTNTATAVQCTTAALANGATVSDRRAGAGARCGGARRRSPTPRRSTTDGSDSDTTDNTSSASITVTAAANQAPGSVRPRRTSGGPRCLAPVTARSVAR